MARRTLLLRDVESRSVPASLPRTSTEISALKRKRAGHQLRSWEVSRSGDDLQICCSYQRNFYPIERMQRSLTPAGWTRVEEELAATSFWTLDSTEKPPLMLDSSDWTIRGRQGGRSHWIKRRSPYGPIRHLGELFIELPGSEEIEDYFRVIPY